MRGVSVSRNPEGGASSSEPSPYTLHPTYPTDEPLRSLAQIAGIHRALPSKNNSSGMFNTIVVANHVRPCTKELASDAFTREDVENIKVRVPPLLARLPTRRLVRLGQAVAVCCPPAHACSASTHCARRAAAGFRQAQ